MEETTEEYKEGRKGIGPCWNETSERRVDIVHAGDDRLLVGGDGWRLKE